MKKRLLSLILLSLLLTGCAAREPLAALTSTPMPGQGELPSPVAEEEQTQRQTYVLWFRFGQEPYLAAEKREMAVSPTEETELALAQALVNGPSAQSMELKGLFPPGTRVISVLRQGRTLFVTLSRQLLSRYVDEPTEAGKDAYWAQELPLRRQLAMQALAATLTENCAVDTVVVLVEPRGSATESLRLRQSYYRTGGGEEPAAPLQRDDALLLTPHTVMDLICQLWQERDWVRLYRYAAAQDAWTGETLPEYEEFVRRMDALSQLVDYEVSAGSVAGNRQATFSVQLTLLRDGQVETREKGVFYLQEEKGLWKVGLSQLAER